MPALNIDTNSCTGYTQMSVSERFTKLEISFVVEDYE